MQAYNREEAHAEAKVLQGKNRWGSVLVRCEPSKVAGFYSVQGWLAGRFQ
jgi:hypothetical protein